MILTECSLSRVDNPPTISTHTSYATKSLYNQNDGVVLYVKSTLKQSIEEPPFSEANCLLLKFGADTVIDEINRPYCLKNSITTFLHPLDSLLCTLKSLQNIIMMGDINIDIDNYS